MLNEFQLNINLNYWYVYEWLKIHVEYLNGWLGSFYWIPRNGWIIYFLTLTRYTSEIYQYIVLYHISLSKKSGKKEMDAPRPGLDVDRSELRFSILNLFSLSIVDQCLTQTNTFRLESFHRGGATIYMISYLCRDLVRFLNTAFSSLIHYIVSS